MICNQAYYCSEAEDYVCPGKYSDGSDKFAGADSCKIDDFDCCVEYNLTADVENRELMWNIPGTSSKNLCCGNNLNEFTIKEDATNPAKLDSQTSYACCTTQNNCVDDGICYESLPIGIKCSDYSISCRDINDDGTSEVCVDKSQWEIIDTDAECKKYIGDLCIYADNKCKCTTTVSVTVIGETVKGKKDYKPSNNAEVIIKSVNGNYLSSKKTVIKDDASVVVFDDVPVDTKMIIQVSKKKYAGKSNTQTFAGETSITLKLDLLDECQPDCTRNDGICHQECIGDGDDFCKVPAEYIVNGKYVCENAKKGWSVALPDSPDKAAYCCQFDAKLKTAEPLVVNTGKVENLQTYSSIIILPDGTPGILYITLCDDLS